MSDIFASRGYGTRSVGFGRKPGVVVVDFQRGFVDPVFPMGGAPMVERAIDTTVRVIETAKAAGVPVIACVMAYDNPDLAPHWRNEWVPRMHPASEGAALDPRIAAAGPDACIVKSAPSIFFGTPAAAMLQKAGVDTVIVTGCITSGCVRASVVDSFSFGFRTMVAEDCVGDHAQDAHDANIRDIARRYADIIDARAAIAAIDRWREANDKAA
jgi:maleamate amidohydrolase